MEPDQIPGKVQQHNRREINDEYSGNIEAHSVDESPKNIRCRRIGKKFPVKEIESESQEKVYHEQEYKEGQGNLQLFCHIKAIRMKKPSFS